MAGRGKIMISKLGPLGSTNLGINLDNLKFIKKKMKLGSLRAHFNESGTCVRSS